MVMLLPPLLFASAVEMSLRIRIAPPGCPRAREEQAEHVVVSYIDGLSLVYSLLPVSILHKAEMVLIVPDRFCSLSTSSIKSPVRLNCVVPFPMKQQGLRKKNMVSF